MGRELLLRDGYRATTVKAVAEQAGVSAETIYKAFGSKKHLMKSIYDVALAGDDEPVPIGRRPVIQRALSASSVEEALTVYGEFVADVQQRLGPLLPLLAEADPDVAEILATVEAERRIGVQAFLEQLAGRGQLRPDLDRDAAADACWALTSLQLFGQLTQTCGWTAQSYQRWLTTMLLATLR